MYKDTDPSQQTRAISVCTCPTMLTTSSLFLDRTPGPTNCCPHQGGFYVHYLSNEISRVSRPRASLTRQQIGVLFYVSLMDGISSSQSDSIPKIDLWNFVKFPGRHQFLSIFKKNRLYIRISIPSSSWKRRLEVWLNSGFYYFFSLTFYKKVIFTVRNSSCGKVMFSQACVKNSDRGGACIAVGCMWQGGIHGRGCVW